MRARVPITELVEAERLRALGAAPSPRALRALLPRGWVPEDDGLHARRDLRVFFGQGWMLALCLVVFGSVGAVFVLGAVPRGWSGVLRVLLMLGVVWLAAGIAAPLITRALKKNG
ncbi:MAG: hypothetical protein EXS08_12655 [Planctomycetes bacterium]|nr:hypothetical protein [Planctomycetota bacterium]